MDWLKKLLDLGIGGLPSAIAAMVPEDLQRKARARLAAYNPFSRISVNHDLVRVTRLAWFDAAEQVVRAARHRAAMPEWRRDAGDINAIASLAGKAITAGRDLALDRHRDPGASPIDQHIETVLSGVPEFVAPGGDSPPGLSVSKQFATVFAEMVGWPEHELPSIFAQLADIGLPVEGGDNRPFGELVFAAFAEIIKNPRRYPEAGTAFAMAQSQQVLDVSEATRDIARTIYDALGELDERLALAISQRDGAVMLQTGAETFLEQLPRIAETVSRIDETTRRTEDKIDQQTTLLQQLLARSAPGLPLATAQAILAAFGENLQPDTEADIERLLRAKAEEFQALIARLHEMDEQGHPGVNQLLENSRKQIEQGDFDGAEETLIAAEDEADLARARIRSNRGDLARLRLRYLEAADHYTAAADIVPASDIPQRWSYLMRSAAATFAQGDEFGDNDSLKQVIADFANKILPLAPRSERPLDWALVQNNRGVALNLLGEREADCEKLEQAFAAHRLALEEFSRENEPDSWAMAQVGIGNALLSLGTRKADRERLESAAAAFRAAMEEYTPERAPFRWALAQNNLGNALLWLSGSGDSSNTMEEAAAAYMATLAVFTSELTPFEWASVQNNLGNALQTIGHLKTGNDSLEAAVIAYSNALEVPSRERMPLSWARAQHNLGKVLHVLGERDNDSERLNQAIAAFRAALTEHSRERVPRIWAATKHALADTLRLLGERGNDVPALVEAVCAYQDALKEYDRNSNQPLWSEIHSHIGSALYVIGQLEKDPERLKNAILAYHAALDAYSSQCRPLDCARIHGGLAEAFISLFDITGEKELLRSAHDHAQSALDGFREVDALDYVSIAELLIVDLNGRTAQTA